MCRFSAFVNFVPIYFKIGTHTDQNNVTHLFMANTYPIIKHRAFFKTLTFCISKNNEEIGEKFLPDTYDHTLMLYKINYLKRSKFKDTLFSKVLLYLIN